MTTTPSCDVVQLSGVARIEQSGSDNGTLFIANEMIPMMASLFIKSANQLNSNIAGHAIAYRAMLRGIQAGLILDLLVELAEREPDRFAPTPQELKRLCLKNSAEAMPSVDRKFIASMSSLEMQICTKCLSGLIAKTQQAVDAELNAMIESVYAKGGEVVGSRGFAPLKSIIRG